MINLLLKQKNKELFSAEFEIIENNNIVGNIFIQGKLGFMEVAVDGNYYEKKFSLKFANKILKGSNKRFRPYSIIENNSIIGEMFQTEFRKNIFSGYGYSKCIYNETEYNMYSIALGKRSVRVLQLNDIQVSETEINHIIYNELYNYPIYAIDKQSAFVSVLMNCYMYIIASYESGVKVTKSTVKYYSKTRNKDLISKYNPEWINSIGGK